jgi:hypothetical protein
MSESSQGESIVKSPRIIVLVTLLTVVAFVAACNPLNEVKDAQYQDYASLVEAGELERGWAPALLPSSATNIHIKYSLENNDILLAFDFAPADAEALTQNCEPLSLALPPRLSADWWPDDLLSGEAARFYECPNGYLALRDSHGYYWAGVKMPADVISVNELDAHPKKYLDLDGQTVTVVGYVDFGNIHDLRDTHYNQEAIGFVRAPGQRADSVFFIYFPHSVDPHALFDEIYALLPMHEESGLKLMATGVLRAYDQPTNFSTRTGYVMDVDSPEDVVILK